MTADTAALSSSAPRTRRADAQCMNQDQREWRPRAHDSFGLQCHLGPVAFQMPSVTVVPLKRCERHVQASRRLLSDDPLCDDVAVHGLMIYYFADGRITEHRHVVDMLSVVQQLGLTG